MSSCSRSIRRPLLPWLIGAPALALALLLVACVPSTPLVLDEERATAPRPGGRAATPEPPVSCRVELRSVVDSRRDPATLGTLSGRPVRPPAEPEAWLATALQGLRREGIEVLTELPSGATADLAVAAELRTAWVASIRANKSANVVVGLSYLEGVATPVEILFRGADTSANWSSSDDEIMRMFDRVFAKLLQSMAVDIKSRCGPGSPAS